MPPGKTPPTHTHIYIHAHIFLTINHNKTLVNSTHVIVLVMPSSVDPFSSCPQSFPASEYFPMNWLFASGDQASVLQHSAFFIIQLSHLYMATGKTIALTIRTMVSKMLSMLFHMLSRFLIAFLPRSKQTSFNFMAAVTIHNDFGAHDNKVCHRFHFYPICLPRGDGTGC